MVDKRPAYAILALTVMFTIIFNAFGLWWNFFTWLSNFDLITRQWNIVGAIWAISLSIYSMITYRKRHVDTNWLVAFMVGGCTMLLYHAILDEMAIFTFIFTRVDWWLALKQFFLITHKWIIWLGVIPLTLTMVWFYARKDLNIDGWVIMVFGISEAIFILQNIFFPTYDLRTLEYPLKTWVYVLLYIPIYAFWAIGYLRMWKERPRR